MRVPLIEVRDLSHSYNAGSPFEVRALSSINLEVREGEAVGIVGPNGCGKSTLVCHLNGILRAQSGEVRVNGRSLSSPSVDIAGVRADVGLVFQNPEDQIFERFAGDDVAYGPFNLGLDIDEVRRRVRGAMETVGLPFELKDRMTEELSRGEKRRLAIAGILAMEPKALVLDEPTANLDPAGRQKIIRALARWCGKESGRAGARRAMVIVSHSIDDIVELADRVYVMAGGRIVMAGSVRRVLSRPGVLAFHGIQVPFAEVFMREVAARLKPVGGLRGAGTALTLEEAARTVGEILDG